MALLGWHLDRKATLLLIYCVCSHCKPASEKAPSVAATATASDEATDSDIGTSTSGQVGNVVIDTAGINLVSELPLLSDPVYAGEPGEPLPPGTVVLNLSSTLGIALGPAPGHEADDDGGLGGLFSGVSGGSYAACEITRLTRGFLQDVGKPDESFCELRALLASLGDRVLDGHFHAYGPVAAGENSGNLAERCAACSAAGGTGSACNGLSPTVCAPYMGAGGGDSGDGGQENASHVRFRIQMTDARITDVVIQRCQNHQMVSYSRITIDGDDIALYTKAKDGGPGSGQANFKGFYYAGATGKLSQEGKFVGEKVVTSKRHNDFESNGAGTIDGHSSTIVAQSPRLLTMNRYYTNTSAFDDTERSQRFYSIFELIDHNEPEATYEFGKLAVGDGAALLFASQAGSGVLQSWNGDTRVTTTSGEQRDEVAAFPVAGVLAVPATPPEIEFVGDELYDCDAEEDLQPTAPSASELTTCPNVNVPQGYVECSDVTTTSPF